MKKAIRSLPLFCRSPFTLRLMLLEMLLAAGDKNSGDAR